MKRRNATRNALLMSVLAMLLCVSMLVGTTFAWFTDSVTNAGNKIQSGSLKIDLELLNKETKEFESIKNSTEAIFSYDKWEPGYTQVEVLKIENEGTLALQWFAKFQSANELSILANVIDVYVNTSATQMPAQREDIESWTYAGTVADFVNTIESTTYGSLYPKNNVDGKPDVAYLGIALKMQETAGNEYQNLDLGGAFDIMILATQETYEKDSFDDQYDMDAEYPVMNVADLKDALKNKENVTLGDDVEIDTKKDGESNAYGKTGLNITDGQIFDGNGNTLSVKDANGTWDSAVSITSGTIKNLTIDSGFRGVFVNHNGTAGHVTLQNVIIDGPVYTISCDQGTDNGLTAIDSTFNGWTSYAATIGNVEFEGCSFGEGAGYAFCRPYAPTAFVNCNFAAGYQMDARAAVTFENCTIGGVALTAENLATLVTGNIANATVK